MTEIGEGINSTDIINSKEVPPVLKEEYNKRKPEIKSLYSQAAYWHGTGRKQYDRNGETVDILDAILDQGGLAPKTDPFTGGTPENIISLSEMRMYAGGYARMNLPKGENLRFQYMSDRFWGTFVQKQAWEMVKANAWTYLRNPGKIRDSLRFITDIRKSGHKWLSRITKEKHRVLPSQLFTVHTDITDNYPILIGVKEGSFTPVTTAHNISRFEVRANTLIPLSGFTHIEVPQTHVQETQDFLNQRGVVNVPVLAMELGEVHSSQFSPQQLVEGNPFRK